VRPPRAWLGALLGRLGSLLGAANAQDLANGLWGLAALGVAPAPGWRAAFNAQVGGGGGGVGWVGGWVGGWVRGWWQVALPGMGWDGMGWDGMVWYGVWYGMVYGLAVAMVVQCCVDG
jgi:hypothetical protein